MPLCPTSLDNVIVFAKYITVWWFALLDAVYNNFNVISGVCRATNLHRRLKPKERLCQEPIVMSQFPLSKQPPCQLIYRRLTDQRWDFGENVFTANRTVNVLTANVFTNFLLRAPVHVLLTPDACLGLHGAHFLKPIDEQNPKY